MEKLSFKLLSNFQSPLRLLEFSTVGHHLVTCGDDKRTVVFNVDDWKIVGERYMYMYMYMYKYVLCDIILDVCM